MKTKKGFDKNVVKSVKEGIKFLDFTIGRKNWLRRMNMKKFDIQLGTQCVAGNVFAEAMFEGSIDGYDSFKAAVEAIGGKNAHIRFGFYHHNETKMQQLQDIWVVTINRLKKQARVK